jgi:hypothetical protein
MSTSAAHPPTTALGAIAADPARDAMRRRIIGAVVASLALGLLMVAAFLEPAAEGVGTHRVFNLPECGWIVVMDLPCPTCGMTTAFAHAADGNLLASMLAQPLGGLLALSAAMAVVLGFYIALTGSRVGRVLTRLWGRRTGWLLAAVVLLSWGFKVLSYKGIL